MMLTEKVSSFILEKNLISPADKIIVAVSGGRDSVCLLNILNSIKHKLRFEISVIHINHGIRAEESDKDEQFVKDLCNSLNINCSCFQLTGFNSKTGENALRKARYKIFDSELAKGENRKIATAHHLNDQLETHLMRLFKGSGVKGMLGIPFKRENYIRPMLECTREEIDGFCAKNSIEFREDLSNSKTDKLRNKIRHNLIPIIKNVFGKHYLEEFQKSHKEFVDLFRENELNNYNFFEKICKKNDGKISVFIDDYSSLSFLKKRQFIEYCISYICGLNSSINKELLSEFNLFIKNSQSGSKFIFNKETKVLKNRKELVFYKNTILGLEPKELHKNSFVKFGKFHLSINQIAIKDAKINNNPAEEIINGDNLKFPLKVRTWEKGDFFYPLGKDQKQKLSDFFINNKISKDQKNEIPLIVSSDEIIWVSGYRISDKYKITKKEKNIYKLKINND